MSEEKVYDDKQVAEIIARAVELGRGASGESSSTKDGTTIEELEGIAAESGIAPELIREAAAELARRQSTGAAQRFFGSPLKSARTFTVPKRLEKATLERMLLELPRLAGNGTGLCSDDGLTWATNPAEAQQGRPIMSVDVRIGENESEVEIVDKRDVIVGSIFGGIGGGLGLGAGFPLVFALGANHLGGLGAWSILIGIGWLSAVWLGCRCMVASWHTTREKAMDKLRTELSRILEKK